MDLHSFSQEAGERQKGKGEVIIEVNWWQTTFKVVVFEFVI